MDGSQSRGDITKYVWDQNTSPTVLLFNADTAICSFVAPEVEKPTTLAFTLTIVDRNGQYSKADSLVHVKPTEKRELIGPRDVNVFTGQKEKKDELGSATEVQVFPKEGASKMLQEKKEILRGKIGIESKKKGREEGDR